MSLYPSLEDMKVDKMAQAQQTYQDATVAQHQAISYPSQGPGAAELPPAYGTAYPPQQTTSSSSLYPSLGEYMGLDLSSEMMERTMPVVLANQNTQLATRTSQSGQMQVAPITGNDIGVRKAEIKQGVREITLCKDQEGKVGLRVRSVNKGVFVAFVHKNSPAALAGLRFGDQILQINNETVAGWDTDKVMKCLKNSAPDRITMAIRDRPFERTLTLQKDSVGHVGFVFKDNKITSIVKDSSAARNGVLTEHHLVEVNGQNVVGLKETEIKGIFDSQSRTVTITIIPTVIYEHIIKSMGSSLIKKLMDHSIPDA